MAVKWLVEALIKIMAVQDGLLNISLGVQIQSEQIISSS